MIYIKSFCWQYLTGTSGGGIAGASRVNGGKEIATLSTTPKNHDSDFAPNKNKSPDFSGLFCFVQEKNLFTTKE